MSDNRKDRGQDAEVTKTDELIETEETSKHDDDDPVYGKGVYGGGNCDNGEDVEEEE